MASAWVIRRKTDAGQRYRVLFRLGGRETKPTYYRVDVAGGTASTHRVNLNRIYDVLGDRDFDAAEASDVAELVTTLHANGLKRESIRKTRSTLAMVFDFGGRRRPQPGSRRKCQASP